MCRLTRGHPGVQRIEDSNKDNAGVEDGDKTVPIEEKDEESEVSSEETESTRETAAGSGVQETVPHITVKVGQRIQGVHKITGELQSGRILSRAGKSTGKYKDCYIK